MSEELKDQFSDAVGNMFDDDEIDLAFEEFEKRSDSDGEINKKDFLEVFGLLFEDPDDENAFQILQNHVLLDAIFKYCDTDSNLSIDIDEFVKGVTTLFEGEGDNFIKFSFGVYDVDNTNTISKENLLNSLKVFLATAISGLIAQADEEGGNVDALTEARTNVLEGDLANECLGGIIDGIFGQVQINDDGVITYEAFYAAFNEDDDLFSWGTLTGDAMQHLEDKLG
eukprot:TRINITY_DN196_c0_g1_i5.p2 TRINITY_DN196_c0_g1~~TRINITY_DN196_c0_g1_i5.p2  ORF type:complete len:226 (+),score=65.55 TRINITY_DN196_c0_g1_i5:35-712(+)